MALKTISAPKVKRSPVPVEAGAVEAGIFELHRRDMPALGQEAQRPGPMLDLHAIDLGEGLLVVGGAHMGGAAAIDDGHILGAQALALHGDIDGGIAAADDHDPAADRQRRLVRGLAQPRDIGDRVLDPGQILPLGGQRIHPGEAHGEEDGVERRCRSAERVISRPKARPVRASMPPSPRMKFTSAWAKSWGSL